VFSLVLDSDQMSQMINMLLVLV